MILYPAVTGAMEYPIATRGRESEISCGTSLGISRKIPITPQIISAGGTAVNAPKGTGAPLFSWDRAARQRLGAQYSHAALYPAYPTSPAPGTATPPELNADRPPGDRDYTCIPPCAYRFCSFAIEGLRRALPQLLLNAIEGT